MKFLCKTLVMLLLLSYAFPFVSAMAIDDNSIGNEERMKSVDNSTDMVDVSQEDKCYNLPHRDVFINTIAYQDKGDLSSGQRAITVWANGFSYEDGYSVNTRGQVLVDAAKAVTDYDDFAGLMEQELATMRNNYPQALILANPTSKYNCHSYAWCETEEMSVRWIPDAELFLRDIHTFKPVAKSEAQIGDIVLYTNTFGVLAHSAVIVQVNGSTIRCVSKWGASVLCEHELEYVPNTYKNNGMCDTLIVRRTEHTGNSQSAGAGQHIVSCTVCNHNILEKCAYSYTYAGDDKHNAVCTECSSVVNGISCSIGYTSNMNRRHTRSCSMCSNKSTENCRLEYTNLTNTTHSASCTKCDYTIASQACQLNYRSKDGVTHTVSCTNCENRRTQDCSHRYISHGDNTHSYLCSQCGYVKIDHAACFFNANNICRVCGAPKNGAVINKLEEITPE